MSESTQNPQNTAASNALSSLPKQQAIKLTEISKTRPQMESISSRNLIKNLPWVSVTGGHYRVNRRQVLEIRPGMVTFKTEKGNKPVILGASLSQMPSLSKIQDQDVLNKIAAAAKQVEIKKNDLIVEYDSIPTHLYIIYSGKVSFFKPGKYDDDHVQGSMGPSQYFGGFGLHYDSAPLPVKDNENEGTPVPPLPLKWDYNAKAMTKVDLFKIDYEDVRKILKEHYRIEQNDFDKYLLTRDAIENINKHINRKGETVVQLFTGFHDSEPPIPNTFVAYDDAPREYELSSGQTILKIHTKVADLYNYPYNQTEEQVRLTVEELRESQEYELINNPDFGLLHNVDYRQRIQTRNGAPTPDDMDELISMRRKTQFIFAPSKAIAAFNRECTKRGIYPPTIEVDGRETLSWRGIPILTCNKIPTVDGVTSIIAMRTGEENQGVVGLYQMGLPDEIEASMSVRFMGIDEKAIISYLITNYFSVAVLVPDALGVLENVEVGIY